MKKFSVLICLLMSAGVILAEETAATKTAEKKPVKVKLITDVAKPSDKKAADTKKAADAKTAAKKDVKTLPLAEARARIAEVIEKPALMSEILKQLSVDDQKKFVSEVNAAIEKMPGSVDVKAATYLNVNRSALKGCSSGNMVGVLATTFATVPPEALTVISERYAQDLFNRNADPSHTYTDAAYEKIATTVLSKIEQTTAGADDAGVRNTLATLMFVRASGYAYESPEAKGLTEKLVSTMPDAETRELASREWIPAALATGDNKSYDAMMAYADVEKSASTEATLQFAGPQITEAMWNDMTSSVLDVAGVSTTPVLDQVFGGFDEKRVNKLDDSTSLGDVSAGPNVRVREDKLKKKKEPEPEPEPPAPPYPYGDLG